MEGQSPSEKLTPKMEESLNDSHDKEDNRERQTANGKHTKNCEITIQIENLHYLRKCADNPFTHIGKYLKDHCNNHICRPGFHKNSFHNSFTLFNCFLPSQSRQGFKWGNGFYIRSNAFTTHTHIRFKLLTFIIHVVMFVEQSYNTRTHPSQIAI